MDYYIYRPHPPPQKTYKLQHAYGQRTRARRPDEHDVAAALGQQVDEECQPHLFFFLIDFILGLWLVVCVGWWCPMYIYIWVVLVG